MLESKIYIKKGVGRNLFISFFIVSLFSFGAAAVGIIGLFWVSNAQNDVIEDVYPSVRNAQRVSLETTGLVLSLPTLFDRKTIEQISISTNSIKEKENNLFIFLKIAEKSNYSNKFFKKLNKEIKILSIKIDNLSKLSESFFNLDININRQIKNLIELTEEVIQISQKSRISNGDELVMKSNDLRTFIENSNESNVAVLFDQFLDANVNALSEISNIQHRAEALKAQLLSLEDIDDVGRLTIIRNEMSINLTGITNTLVRINSRELRQNLAAPFSNISNAVLSTGTIFLMKEKKINFLNEIEIIRASAEDIGEAVKLSVLQFVRDVQQTMDDKSTAVQKTTANTQTALTIVALLSAVTSTAIYFIYINNNIIYRLQRLYTATSKINNGDFRSGISNSGQDEITDLEKAAEKFRLNSLKLQDTERTLQNHADNLERSNRDLEQFAYVTSHDLRGPLRGISSLTEWIEEDIETGDFAKVTENLKRMRSRAARMDSLLSGILRYSRAGHEADKPILLPVKETIENVFNDLNITDDFRLELQCETGDILVKEAYLKQVAGNLIANAIKHHDKEIGIISVHFFQKDGNHNLIVSDDGPGIPEKMHEKVFKIFQTLKPQDELEASGIGLSLVKRLVDRHKGKITIEQSDQGGAKFTVVWPAEKT